MSRINSRKTFPKITTHEGAPAINIAAEQMLRRSVMACMLWEDEFYEDGVAISTRLADLVKQVKPERVADIAIEAREQMHLRHVPLFLVRELARGSYPKTADVLSRVIQRADELSEFVAIYWKEKRQPLSAQVKKGLARAFVKFDEYQIAKYDRDSKVRLRDVLFLSHAKPIDKKQAAMWKRLVNEKLKTPDTWEVALSAAKDKKKEWTRLLKEDALGGMALLRNLRNMEKAGVSRVLKARALRNMRTDRILPFRFIAAARYAPEMESEIEAAMFRSLQESKSIPGHTVILVDNSGSMETAISAKSDLSRVDAACGVAIVARELCKSIEVFSFSDSIAKVPARRGFALVDAIKSATPVSGTNLGYAIQHINNNVAYDRLIVITDEQSHDRVPPPKKGRGYVINVASYRNGIGYGTWTHIDGWSDAVLKYIMQHEEN